MTSLVAVLTLAVVATVFAGGLIFLTALVGPKVKATASKMMPYECGIPGIEKKDTKISIKFYLIAILFILFDIEVVFMYPWALIFRENLAEYGAFLFFEMMVFMGILVFGLFYVWKARALEWE